MIPQPLLSSALYIVFTYACLCLSVQPAPLSETVDHTVGEDYPLPPHKAFQPPALSRSPSPSPPPPGTDDSCEEESEEEEVLSARGE